jgi:excisionase family DNA binding protein
VSELRIDLGDEALDALADRIVARLAGRLDRPPVDDGWLTAHEAAGYLGISYSTMKKRMAAGELPCEREGGRVYFKRSDLDAWRRG